MNAFPPRFKKATAQLLGLMAGAATLFAADEVRPPGNRPLEASVHALVGGRVVIRPGTELEKATIVIRDGRFVAVAPDAAVPAEARFTT